MKKTSIEWCDHTFNPWWGCTKIGPACTNCYAEGIANRFADNIWGPRAQRRFFGETRWEEPRRWERAAKKKGIRARVFCASMADVFEIHRDETVNGYLDATRGRLWSLIEKTPSLDWLLLTKRPDNIVALVPNAWIARRFPRNVWLGVSFGTQDLAEERLDSLARFDVTIKFASYEPALEQVDLLRGGRLAKLDWLIMGAESGRSARPMHPDWARAMRDQCAVEDVPFFLKQFAKGGKKISLPELDGVVHNAFPIIGAPKYVSSQRDASKRPERCERMTARGTQCKKTSGLKRYHAGSRPVWLCNQHGKGMVQI